MSEVYELRAAMQPLLTPYKAIQRSAEFGLVNGAEVLGAPHFESGALRVTAAVYCQHHVVPHHCVWPKEAHPGSTACKPVPDTPTALCTAATGQPGIPSCRVVC